MVELIKYFYPSQFVQANASHVTGEKSAIPTEIIISHGLAENNPNNLVIDVTLLLDKEKSQNYPYDFKLQIFGIFKVSQDENLSLEQQAMIGTQLLIGCLRERLSLLTQGGPWNQITLSFQPVSHLFSESEDKSED